MDAWLDKYSVFDLESSYILQKIVCSNWRRVLWNRIEFLVLWLECFAIKLAWELGERSVVMLPGVGNSCKHPDALLATANKKAQPRRRCFPAPSWSVSNYNRKNFAHLKPDSSTPSSATSSWTQLQNIIYFAKQKLHHPACFNFIPH